MLIADGLNWLSTTFKTCDPIKDKDEVTGLKNWLVDIYTDLAMGNYPYPADFLAELPAYPVKVIFKICDLTYLQYNGETF